MHTYIPGGWRAAAATARSWSAPGGERCYFRVCRYVDSEREAERERCGSFPPQKTTIKHREKVNLNGFVMFSPVRFPLASFCFGFATNLDKLVRFWETRQKSKQRSSFGKQKRAISQNQLSFFESLWTCWQICEIFIKMVGSLPDCSNFVKFVKCWRACQSWTKL